MLANTLKKAGEPQQLELYFSKGGRYRLTYDPTFQSARRRAAKGIRVLDDGTGPEARDLVDKFDSLFNDVEDNDQAKFSDSEEELNLTDET